MTAASEASSKFTIDLALEGEAESKQMQTTIEGLRASIDKGNKSAAAMQTAFRNMKKGGLENTATAKELKARLEATKKTIGENTASLLKMRGGLGLASGEAKKFAVNTKGAALSLGGLAAGAQLGGGPIASLAAKASILSSALGKAGLVGAAVAVTAAIIALDVVVLKHTVDLAKMAITAADAYRSENLALQGMTKAWVGWWGQVKAGKASDVQGAIDMVASRVPIAREKIASFAQDLYKSRLRGKSLSDALLGVSMAASAAGDEYGEVAKGMVVSSAMWGRSVNGTVDLFKARFGGIVSKQMLALPTQLAKARENFSALFRGINIEPVLKGLHNVLGIVDQGTVEFKAWKQMFESLFNPLFAGAEEGGSVIRKFFDKVTILSLRAMLSWEKMKGSFSLKGIGLESTAQLLSAVVRGSTDFAIGLLRATQGVIYLTDTLVSLGQAMTAISRATYAVAHGDFKGAMNALNSGVKGLFDPLVGGSEASKKGQAMIQGLIDGIKLAQPALNSAVISAARESNAAFKGEQQIRSPSRKWFGFGANMGVGAALGVKASTPRFAAATTALARIPSAQPGSAGFPGSSGAARAVGFGGAPKVDLVLHNVPQGAQVVTVGIAELKAAVASMLEGLAIQRGALAT